MWADNDTPYATFLDLPLDPQCDNCGRSIVVRFGGLPSAECASCDDDFERYLAAGNVYCLEDVG